MSNGINKNSLLVANQNLVATELNSNSAQSMVILTLDEGVYYELKGIAVRVWELLQKPASIEAISNTLLSEYTVDAAQCESDLIALTAELHRRKLIEIVSPD